MLGLIWKVCVSSVFYLKASAWFPPTFLKLYFPICKIG